MKTTIDIADDLYRDVKAEAARRGLTVREVTTELYRAWLADRVPAPVRAPDPAAIDAYLAQLRALADTVAAGPDLMPGTSALDQLSRDRSSRG